MSYNQPFIKESARTVGSGEQYAEYIEGREVFLTTTPPAANCIELARVYHTATDRPVTDAKNPADPGGDEINLLHRRLAFPHCYADVTIGELSYVPMFSPDWKPNRAGLCNLIQEASGRGFHLDFAGQVTVENEITPPALLYLAGREGFQPFSETQIAGLRRLLDAGTLLLGDAGGEDGFTKAFTELAGQLGANLQPLPADHRLLKAHYVFAAPPPGSADGGPSRMPIRACC